MSTFTGQVGKFSAMPGSFQPGGVVYLGNVAGAQVEVRTDGSGWTTPKRSVAATVAARGVAFTKP